jgi:hypothetical protein
MPTGGENLMRALLTPTCLHAADTAALYTAGPSLTHHVVFVTDARVTQAACTDAVLILYGWLKLAITLPELGSPCNSRLVTFGARNEAPAAVAAAAASRISGRKYCM